MPRRHMTLICVSCLTWERDNSPPRKPTFDLCIEVLFDMLRLCQGDGSFTESLGTNILWPHAKTVANASISFVESAEEQCLLTGLHVVQG